MSRTPGSTRPTPNEMAAAEAAGVRLVRMRVPPGYGLPEDFWVPWGASAVYRDGKVVELVPRLAGSEPTGDATGVFRCSGVRRSS